MNVFAARAAKLAEARPELAAAVEPLLKAREAPAGTLALVRSLLVFTLSGRERSLLLYLDRHMRQGAKSAE